MNDHAKKHRAAAERARTIQTEAAHAGDLRDSVTSLAGELADMREALADLAEQGGAIAPAAKARTSTKTSK